MIHIKITCVVFALFFSNTLYAQHTQAVAMEAFHKAAAMRKEANQLDGSERAEALRLLTEANNIYQGDTEKKGKFEHQDFFPRYHLNALRDFRGANQAAEDAIDRYSDMVEVMSPNGSFSPATDYIKKTLLLRASMNLDKGDFSVTAQDIKRLIALGVDKKDYKTNFNDWLSAQTNLEYLFRYAQYEAFLNEDADLLQQMHPALEKVGDDIYVTMGLVYLAILSENYTEALSLASGLEQKGVFHRINARFMTAWTYALQHETAKSEEYVKLVVKNILVTDKMAARVRALNALNEKQYEEALKYINDALKPSGFLKQEAGGKFFLYKLRGDAYVGLKQFEKAKLEYEKALLYNEQYKPALKGLANIEALIANERKTDTTAPLIKIITPVANRGLIITQASTEIMLKGFASDPSGIQSLTANGEDVYFQTTGDFWGNVKLAEGNNSITIAATDKVGNRSETIIEVAANTEVTKKSSEAPVRTASKNYALIIAAQNYDDSSIPSLENPVADGIRLKLVLKNNYNFAEENIYTLYNPIVSDFKKQFATLMDEIQPEDNLIIFYAGHGIWVEKEKKGYWLLTDAKRNDVNSWLSNKFVLDEIAKIPSRHTLLITDACFSGSVFKTRGLDADAPQALQEMDQKISRVAITSGNDSEVPDESVFMKYLVKALSENSNKYLTAQKMFVNHIIESVMTETKTEPRYGTLESAGHIGGDYVFMKK